MRASGQLRAAMELLLTLDPGRPDVAYQMAWVLDSLDRDDEAIGWYRRALKANAEVEEGRLGPQDHLGALLGLATVLIRSGRPDHAEDVLKAASGGFPSSDQVDALLRLVRRRLVPGEKGARDEG